MKAVVNTNMAGEATLDSLSQLVTKLGKDLSQNMDRMSGEIKGSTDKLSEVKTKMDTKIENLRTSLEQKIGQVKDDVKGEVQQKIDAGVSGVKDEMVELREQLESAQCNVARLTELVGVQFAPNRSVVIYGLANVEEMTDWERVHWLFNNILSVKVTIEDIEHTKPRNDKDVGVVKVELTSLDDKIAVLRSKRKCETNNATKGVTIKHCESHEERVNCKNNKFMLEQMDIAPHFIITGHGLIKRKQDKRPAQDDDGGNGSVVAGTEEDEGTPAAPVDMGDNGGPCGDTPPRPAEQTRNDTKQNDDRNPSAGSQSDAANGAPKKPELKRNGTQQKQKTNNRDGSGLRHSDRKRNQVS